MLEIASNRQVAMEHGLGERAARMDRFAIELSRRLGEEA